jgi:hypothetical protein
MLILIYKLGNKQMKITKLNKQGFGHVELISLLVVVLAIVGIGAYMFG